MLTSVLCRSSLLHLACLVRVSQRSVFTMASDPSVGPPDQSAEKKQLSKQLSNARRASTVHRLQRPLRPAAELDDPVPASLSIELPSDSDLSVVVERQLGYTGNVTDYNVFKVGCRCRRRSLQLERPGLGSPLHALKAALHARPKAAHHAAAGTATRKPSPSIRFLARRLRTTATLCDAPQSTRASSG